jgi:hypothetical protein
MIVEEGMALVVEPPFARTSGFSQEGAAKSMEGRQVLN